MSACWVADIGSARPVICSGNQFLEVGDDLSHGCGLGQHIQFAAASQTANTRMMLARSGSAPLVFIQVTARIAPGEELFVKGADCRLQAPR
jgi:hypothetical protein